MSGYDASKAGHSQLSILFKTMDDVAQLIIQDQHDQLLKQITIKPTIQQMATLLFLIEHDGRVTVSALARQMSVSLSAVTAVSNRMLRDGLIRRLRDEDDRRVVWLELTPVGRHAVEVFEQIQVEVYRRFFGVLSVDDIAQLYSILIKIKNNARPGACRWYLAACKLR